MIDACEICVTVEEAKIAQNQVLPSTLMQPFHGSGFGCGSVAILVTIRDMSRS
jgi:hypothetical protein